MNKFNPEHLRPLETMKEPDPRWLGFGGFDSNGEFKTITLEDYAKPIQEISLDKSVPESVVTHFETSKNLALYAWNVYRFTTVAELHAFISIEFALRDKTGNKKLPFKVLFKRAIDAECFSNEYFSQWQLVTEKNKRMHQANLDIAKVLDKEPPEEPQYWNYLEVLMEYIPYFRNTYAHGSSSIKPWAYSTLQMAAEIINQIYHCKNKIKNSTNS